MRGATLVLGHPLGAKVISIHAPHAERDLLPLVLLVVNFISIHAPLAGCDEGHLDPAQLEEIFQSTHPSRGATADKVTERLRHEISIHAPHAGRDVILNPIPQEVALFQSTRPVRGATRSKIVMILSGNISIHAPHAGRDCCCCCCSCRTLSLNFNPRAPCGARPKFMLLCR